MCKNVNPRCNDSIEHYCFFFLVSGKLIRDVLYSTWFSFSYLVIVVLGFAGILLIPVSGSKLLLDSLLGGLRQVCRLYILLHTDQRLFQSVEGTRVQHLLLNLGRVGTPRHQEQFLFLGCLRKETIQWLWRISESSVDTFQVYITVKQSTRKWIWLDNYLGSTLTLMGIFKVKQPVTALPAAALL